MNNYSEVSLVCYCICERLIGVCNGSIKYLYYTFEGIAASGCRWFQGCCTPAPVRRVVVNPPTL